MTRYILSSCLLRFWATRYMLPQKSTYGVNPCPGDESCDLFPQRRYVGGWLDTVLKWSYEVITARHYCDHVTRTGIYVTLRDMTRSHVTIVTTINLRVSISGQVSSYMCELLASMNAFEVWSYMMTPAPMKEYRICILTILYNFWPERKKGLEYRTGRLSLQTK